MCRELLAEQLQHARAWNTHKFSAKNWSRFRGPSVAVYRGLTYLELFLPSWRVSVLAEKIFDTRLACSKDVNFMYVLRSETRHRMVWAEKDCGGGAETWTMVGACRVDRFLRRCRTCGHQGPKAHLLCYWLSIEIGRSKDNLIWRCCDPNNCLHCGPALRTKQTMRRVCSEQCTCCRSCSRILNYCSLCRLHRSLCSNGMSWTRWRAWRRKRCWSAWLSTHECELSL